MLDRERPLVLAALLFAAATIRAQDQQLPFVSVFETGVSSTPILTAAVRAASPLVDNNTLDRLYSPILRKDLKISGAASCSAASCHGGPQPGVAHLSARRGSEYQIWKENDPHARSWRTICSPQSVLMMQRLRIMDGQEIIDQVAFQNCLACHNSDRDYNGNANHFASVEFHREGVGCAACHGPSEHWIGTHYQDAWSAADATHDGFVAVGDLYVRARMCASCHVGDKDRDMNHDIIAAGHPPLRYEFATYHARQPKHWRDPESCDPTYYEAQLWLAGQVAATDASLSLLQARAVSAISVSQWPEFAAYDCASCHHEFGLKNGRPSGETSNGMPAYSRWNDSGLRWLIEYRIQVGESNPEDTELLTALDAVRATMQSGPRPDKANVASAAAHARTALSAWFEGLPGTNERANFRSERLRALVTSAAANARTFRTWESAVQFYLALVAARESWPQEKQGPVGGVAERMRLGLQNPVSRDISRYITAKESRSILNRTETMAIGKELASWLQTGKPQAPPLHLSN